MTHAGMNPKSRHALAILGAGGKLPLPPGTPKERANAYLRGGTAFSAEVLKGRNIRPQAGRETPIITLANLMRALLRLRASPHGRPSAEGNPSAMGGGQSHEPE